MEALIAALDAVLGSDAILTGSAIQERYQSPWTRLGAPLAVLRPASTQAVADSLRLASAAGVSVVPWGGRTGLVDGCLADGALAISLDRMAAVEAIDSAAGTITVQAGCVLQTASEAAAAQGLLLPLDLGARGSATIGGTIATNAGGNRVLRYGMMRDMVLGLEAVLADGTVIQAMSPLIKNNAGYDLKQLFIGSEGTLGVITRLVLRLRERPRSHNVAFVAIADFGRLTDFLKHMDSTLGGSLSAFEAMWREFYQLVTTAPAKSSPPLPHGHAYYVLVESLGADQEHDAARLEAALEGALNLELIADAAVARSERERAAIWAMRDDVMQTARHGMPFIFDVSLPIATMEAYVAEVRAALAARWPQHHCWVFGHLGDGNLHLAIRPAEAAANTHGEVESIVYTPLARIGGSVSAEHGVGLEKKSYLHLCRNDTEIALMRTLKRSFDPNNILNPGKIF